MQAFHGEVMIGSPQRGKSGGVIGHISERENNCVIA